MAGKTIGSMISDDERVGITIAPKDKPEAKSRHVTLAIRPSVYDKARKKCKNLGVSFNDAVNQFLESWVEE